MSCSRRRFLQLVPTAALGVIGATALPQLLAACGPAIAGTVTPQNGTATLSFAEYPALSNVDGGVLVDTSNGGPIAVVRTGAATAVALSAVCTHAGCTVEVASGGSDLQCPCHGSVFALTGAVVRGPAERPLAVYAATVTSTGIDVALA